MTPLTSQRVYAFKTQKALILFVVTPDIVQYQKGDSGTYRKHIECSI